MYVGNDGQVDKRMGECLYMCGCVESGCISRKDGMLMRCMRDGRRDVYGYVCMSYMYYDLIRDERREIRDRESEGENEEVVRKEGWRRKKEKLSRLEYRGTGRKRRKEGRKGGKN